MLVILDNIKASVLIFF